MKKLIFTLFAACLVLAGCDRDELKGVRKNKLTYQGKSLEVKGMEFAYGNEWDDEGNEIACVEVEFYCSENMADDDGLEIEFSFSVYTTKAHVFPSGTYLLPAVEDWDNAIPSANTICTDNDFVVYDDDESEKFHFVEGTLQVDNKGDNLYELTFSGTLENGEKVTLNYTGKPDYRYISY